MSEVALGLDVGAVRTKAAGTALWHGPTAFADAPGGRRYGAEALAGGVLRHGFLAARSWRSLGEFLGGVVAPGGPVDVAPDRASVVMAVPDEWTRGAGPTWTSAVDTTPNGVEARRVLGDVLGFASVRLVPATQCAASDYLDRKPGVRGCLLVCDVGAGTVDAAVFACGAGTTRLLDAEHGEVADTGLADRLLRASAPGSGDDPVWRLMALEHARCRGARRARVVLDRAVTHERYLETPAYLAGPHGGALTARVVLDALRPLADLVARVVAAVSARVAEPLLPEVVATGGNVLGPVEAALGERVHLLDPGAAARGARSIAAGRTTALDGYPHELGVAVRRVERGLLRAETVPISADTPVTVDVREDHRGPLPVLVRLDRTGPWRETTAAVDVPAGTYLVTALGNRAGLGAVLLRPVDGGPDVVCRLGAEAGQARRSS
jgi:hypothetical protein